MGDTRIKNLKRTYILAFALFALAGALPGTFPKNATGLAFASSAHRRDADDKRLESVKRLRMDGEYDTALSVLRHMAQEYSGNDRVMKQLYNELVFTLLSAGERDEAEAVASEGLRRFPDLEADDVFFPSMVDTLYDDLRARLFGSLSVRTTPPACSVSVDDKYGGR